MLRIRMFIRFFFNKLKIGNLRDINEICCSSPCNFLPQQLLGTKKLKLVVGQFSVKNSTEEQDVSLRLMTIYFRR